MNIKTWQERMPKRLPEGMLDTVMMQCQSMSDEIDELRAALQAQPVQEPVHWRAMLDPKQIPLQPKTNLHAVGFRKKKDGESWIAEQLDFKEWRYTLEPLYAALVQPVQSPHWQSKPAHPDCKPLLCACVDVCKFKKEQ